MVYSLYFSHSSHVLVSLIVETFDESGEQICFNQFTTFAVGAGGFGGKRTSKYNKVIVCTGSYMYMYMCSTYFIAIANVT